MPDDGDDQPLEAVTGLGRLERTLPESEAVLWTVVVLASTFDVVTTMVGVGRGLEEGNAVAVAFMDVYGASGIGLLKFSALVVVVVLWAALPERYGVVVLQAFALVSLLVVGLNAVTLAGV
jgi:hypothetical protein